MQLARLPAQRSIEHGTPEDMAHTARNRNELSARAAPGVVADDITNLTGIVPRTLRERREDHAQAFR